jgi:SPP1 gp7 family putative phage head morphogenesis protein
MAHLGDDFWKAEDKELYDAMSDIYQDIIRDAIAQAEEMIGSIDPGIPVSFDAILQNVQDWAKSYTYDTVRGINATTRDKLQSAMSDWWASGEPLSALEDVIADMPEFGEGRADLIAMTETTRAYAEGQIAAWDGSGVVQGMRWMTTDENACPICTDLDGAEDSLDGDFGGDGPPPAHPGCRCALQPVVSEVLA